MKNYFEAKNIDKLVSLLKQVTEINYKKIGARGGT